MENPLLELQEYENLREALKRAKGPVHATGTLDSQKVHLMYWLGKDGGFPWKLVVTYDDQRAREIYEDFRSFTENVWLYPAKDLLFYSADIHGNLMTRQRIAVWRHLMEEKEGVVVTTLDGLMDHLLPLVFLKQQAVTVENGQIMDLDEWKERLTALGYERTAQVDGMGQFSIRGGIVDIFPLTEEVPVRIELWDDEVDSIRSFDAESQRSLENVDEITIYPAAEKMDGEDMVSFMDYFPEEKTLVFLDELNHLAENGEGVEEEYRQSRMHREEKGEANLPEQWLCGFQELQKKLNRMNCVAVSALSPRRSGWKINEEFDLTVKSVDSYNSSFELLVKDLIQYKSQGYRIALLSGSRTRA